MCDLYGADRRRLNSEIGLCLHTWQVKSCSLDRAGYVEFSAKRFLPSGNFLQGQMVSGKAQVIAGGLWQSKRGLPCCVADTACQLSAQRGHLVGNGTLD